MEYSGAVAIYDISRAGFVPQLSSLRLPNPSVVFELLEKGNAKALVYNPSYKNFVASIHLHQALSTAVLGEYSSLPLPSFPIPESKDELAIISHTAGSTSGSPKLVPCSAEGLDSMFFKYYESIVPVDLTRQDMSMWL